MIAFAVFALLLGSLSMTACSGRPSAKKLNEVDTEVLYQGSVAVEHVKGEAGDQLVFTFKTAGGYNVKLEGKDLTKDFDFSPSPRKTTKSFTVPSKSFPINITVTKQGNPPEKATLD